MRLGIDTNAQPSVDMTGGRTTGGLLQIATPTQTSQMEAAEKAKRDEEQRQQTPEILGLAAYLQKLWQSAKDGKIEIDNRLLKCQRQRKGEYDPDMAAKIAAHGGSDIFMMITSMKCRAAEAWLKDIIIPPGEKPWGIAPTPDPELPDDMQDEIDNLVDFETYQLMMESGIESVTVEQVRDRVQELKDEVFKDQMSYAKEATLRLERRIEDQFREGEYYIALDKFIDDLTTFPTAFVGGPFIKKEKTLEWSKDESGQDQPQVTEKLKKTYRRISPFNLYPSKGAKSLQDGYLFEIIRFRRSELRKFRGVPGYSDSAIDLVLENYGKAGFREWLWYDQEKAEVESKPQYLTDPEPIIDALLFWGQMQGEKLKEWNSKKFKDLQPLEDYQIVGMLIGRYVVMARINPHPLGKRPYFGASYETVADSIWGKALPELMADIQKICNAAARSAVNNMAIASGPMVEVHYDRIFPGEDVEDIYPWKVTKTKSDETGGRDSPAVYYHQPKDTSAALMKVYEYWFNQASEVTGIPQYFQGSQQISGAGKTASGLSMLMNAATKTLKGVIFHIDGGVITPIVKEHWLNVMLYDDDIEKAGDINVIARASDFLMVQEQLQLRRTEFLEMTNNEIDMLIMGIEGRAAILREQVKSLKMPSADIIPSKEDLKAKLEGNSEDGQPALLPPSPGPGGNNKAKGIPILPGGQRAGGQEARVAG